MSALAALSGLYGWWILGLILLGLEALLPGVYLLFFGIAALVVGANLVVFPDLGMGAQIVGFAVVAAVSIFLGHRWYGARRTPGRPEHLNARTERLIGRTGVVTDAIVGGTGRVAVEDGWWSATGPDLGVGTRVVITGASGSQLAVVPSDSSAAGPIETSGDADS